MTGSGHGEEIDAYWIHGSDGPSPVFPGLSFFRVNDDYRNYDVWVDFNSGCPEPRDIVKHYDPSERLLDQNGKIFSFVNHRNGFYYPKLIGEVLSCSHLMDAIKDIGETEFEKFLPLKELNAYMQKHCSDYPFAKG